MLPLIQVLALVFVVVAVITNVVLEVDRVAAIAIVTAVVKKNAAEVVRGINLALATEADLPNAVTLAVLVAATKIVGKCCLSLSLSLVSSLYRSAIRVAASLLAAISLVWTKAIMYYFTLTRTSGFPIFSQCVGVPYHITI